jgi:hypothetical protein
MFGLRLLLFSALTLLIVSCKNEKGDNYYSVDDFAKVKKYDTHVHIESDQFQLPQQAKADNFILLDINGDWGPPYIPEQKRLTLLAKQKYPDQVRYASSFEAKNFDDPQWVNQAIDSLKDSFNKGAIAVKVWKNIGMELKDKDSNFVMIDNPRIDTILDFIAKNNITLLSHQGEPKNCWLPLDQMTVEGDRNYFRENPQYHMYLHPEYPSYEQQIAARDHMIEKHPNLKIVSVHLASLEWNVDEIAKRLDKFPNMAVDIAARIEHLQYAAATDWNKIHDFLVKYQDRILYGTDMVETPEADATIAADIHNKWLNDWKFFVSDEMLTNDDKKTYKGMHLPKTVVDKIYAGNAERWIPGLAQTKDTIFPKAVTSFKPYDNNPVFTAGDSLAWDRKIRERGFILHEDNTYKMWYTGYSSKDDNGVKSLGYATSPDGIHWTRYPHNPIFNGKWTEDMMVLKDSGTYYMYAEGKNDVAHYLTSTDGIRWKERGDLVIVNTYGDTIPGPYGTPAVFVENGNWYLFYERNDEAVWCATSTDHKLWRNISDEPVLKPGPEKFDLAAIAADQVIKYNNRYYMYYHATADLGWLDKPDAPWSSNVAVSDDLLHWKKYSGNPIVEGDHSSPVLVPDGEKYRLYTMHPNVFLYMGE